jgi:DNA polymerase-3 subunit beta
MLKTEKAALSAALSAATSIVSASNTIPILQNVLIERDGDDLVAFGGNQDMEISARCQATFAADFRPFTVSAARLTEIVKAAPETTVAIEAVDDALTAIHVKSGRSRLKLPTLPADAYHKLTARDLVHQLGVSAETLAAALKAVAYAASKDFKVQPYLAGVHFDGDADGLNLVATDGKRVERRLIRAIEFDEDRATATIPKITVGSEVVTRLIKLLDSAEDAVLRMSEARLQATVGNVVLTSKLVEGNFPPWRRIIPTDLGNRYLLPVKTVVDALGRVMIVNGDGGNGIRLSFEAGSVAIEARDMANGDAREDLPVEFDTDVIIGFHGLQLRGVLEHMKGDVAELYISEPKMPAVIHPVGDPINLCVLLPMAPKGFFDGK